MLHQVIYRQLNYGIHRLQEKATLGLYLFAYLHLPHDDDENFENLFQEEKRELLHYKINPFTYKVYDGIFVKKKRTEPYVL